MNGKFRIAWQVERQDPTLRKALETMPLEALLTVRNRTPQRPDAPQYMHLTSAFFEGMRFSVTKDFPEPHYVIAPLPTPDVKEVTGYERSLSHSGNYPEIGLESARKNGMQVIYANRKFTLYFSNHPLLQRK